MLDGNCFHVIETSNQTTFFYFEKDYIRSIYAPIAEDFRMETYQVGNVARRNFEWVETSGVGMLGANLYPSL